ncbi:MAG: citrate synthase [Armatimonadetes bacterium]|nr:citrate synthase [Armatimonadota bacterium]
MAQPAYSPGLEGVIAGETAISTITDEGLFYRGYFIQDLAEKCTFEEVAHLLICGELPSRTQLEEFRARLNEHRCLGPATLALLRHIPPATPPMDMLRTAVSFLGHFDPEAQDLTTEANQRKAVRLLASVPTVIGVWFQMQQGREPLAPRPELSHAGNLLYLITGEPPSATAQRVMDLSLILYAEHEFNASTFAARVTVSTMADLHCGIVSAIGALKGPWHGGANEQAMEMMLEIGDPERAEAWVMDALARKERIMGFGHRVVRRGDLRARLLTEAGRQLAEQAGEYRWLRMAETMERVMEREKGLKPNVDFPCGWVYYMLGLPVAAYTPIFVAARIAGWSAHISEQLAHNRIIRPRSLYTGPARRPVPPLEERGTGQVR